MTIRIKKEKETEKAIYAQILWVHPQSEKINHWGAWLPKSQVVIAGYKDNEGIINESYVDIPDWLAKKINDEIVEKLNLGNLYLSNRGLDNNRLNINLQ